MRRLLTPAAPLLTAAVRSVPCAGFRQCGSNTGLTGLNPKANKWDAPLELRCAQNDNLTKWGPPDYIFPVYYYRGLPCALLSLPLPAFLARA